MPAVEAFRYPGSRTQIKGRPPVVGSLTDSTADGGEKGARAHELWDENRYGGFVCAGGILMLVAGVTGIVLSWLSSIIYASGQPTDAAGYLQLFSQHRFLAFTEWTVWIIGDLWLVPGSIAVYLALKRSNKGVAAAGTILSLVHTFYDVNFTKLNSLNLVRLSRGYAGAVADATRAAYIASAAPSVSVLPVQTFFSFAIGALGWLLWSLIMAKSFFGKWSAVFGVIANVMGILGGAGALVQGTSFAPLGFFITLGGLATALWFILIGVELFRHGNNIRRGVASPIQR